MSKRRWKKSTSLNEGDVFKTRYDREFTIGGYDSTRNNYECIFTDLTKWVSKGSIHSGSIRHPNDKTVFSKGFIGIGVYDSKVHKDSYKKWIGMMKRCYADDSYYQRIYENVTVSEDWHNFQNFSKWFYAQQGESDWELDKDLFYLDKRNKSKKYSSETCFLIPRELNSMIRGFRYNPKVQKEKLRYRAYATIRGQHLELGRFLRESNAKMAIAIAKVGVIEQWIKEINLPFNIDSAKLIEEVCKEIKDEN